jgi:hypothetical protein
MFLNKKILLPLVYWESSLTQNINEASDLIVVSKDDYVKITGRFSEESFKETAMIFKIFANDHVSKSTRNAMVRIGGFHNDDVKVIYAPQWVIDQIKNGADLVPNTDSVFGLKVKLMQIYEAPVATSITIKIINFTDVLKLESYGLIDGTEIYQNALQKYGGVEFNRIVPLELEINDELLNIEVKIVKVEPLNIHGYVRFNGDVNLEIEETEPPEPSVITESQTEGSESQIEGSQSQIEGSEPSIIIPTREELRNSRLAFLNRFKP